MNRVNITLYQTRVRVKVVPVNLTLRVWGALISVTLKPGQQYDKQVIYINAHTLIVDLCDYRWYQRSVGVYILRQPVQFPPACVAHNSHFDPLI